ncbi:MAG TPA: hypothetical protein VJ600_00190 [Holophagaceae bacterium]|nr:hypothetical protein [Holophagaceae bacterium]
MTPIRIPDRIARLPFLAWGSSLFLLKASLDALVFRAFGETWSPLVYVHPGRAPLFHPESHWGLWFSLWGLAIPFLVVGTLFTLARLRDAGLPQGLVALFFLPFANLLFFALAALVPTTARPEEAAGKGGGVPSGTAFWVASAAGMILFLGGMALSLGLLKVYGLGLFVGTPFLAGFASARILARLQGRSRGGQALLAAGMAALLSMAVMALLALEGLVCMLMATPLVLVLALAGAAVGHLASRAYRPRAWVPCLALLPILTWMDGLRPEPPLREVVSEVVVSAPPEAVWSQVVAFPELPPPKEWLFRAGVAAPLRAQIQGEGPGALRRCQFTTGDFVEPITVWDPGRELAFSVQSQPDVLRELTLYPGPRPPHLDDYLRCTRGRFLIEPLPGGRTRLVGTTWYQLRMGPQAYWGWWSDAFIHRIHLRVLNHVAALAEAHRG